MYLANDAGNDVFLSMGDPDVGKEDLDDDALTRRVKWQLDGAEVCFRAFCEILAIGVKRTRKMLCGQVDRRGLNNHLFPQKCLHLGVLTLWLRKLILMSLLPVTASSLTIVCLA